MLLINTKDKDLIREFMLQDEVWEMFSDDMATKDKYYPDMSTKSAWLKVVIDDELAGVVLLDNYNLTTLSLHPYLSRKFRKHSRELIIRVFHIFMRTPDFINKLIVEIPFNRKIVYNLAKKSGFKDEGVNRESHLKNGIYYDQWNLGLTKKEIKGMLWVS
jgi:hypothetical protein